MGRPCVSRLQKNGAPEDTPHKYFLPVVCPALLLQQPIQGFTHAGVSKDEIAENGVVLAGLHG